MALDHLRRILPLPEIPRDAGSQEDWATVEHMLDFVFPRDYKEFINVYGTGGVNDFIWLISPMPLTGRPLDDSYLRRPVAALRQMRDEFGPRVCPYPLYPEPGGLVAWGQTTNGDTLYWRTDSSPDTWPVIIVDLRSAEFEEYSETMTGFLTKLLTGEIITTLFPDDFLAEAARYSQDYVDLDG